MRHVFTRCLVMLFVILLIVGCSLGERFNEYDPYSKNFKGVPEGLAATDGSYTDKIELTWHHMDSVKSYLVYRRDASGDSFSKIGESLTTSFTDSSSSFVPYHKYEYTIKAYLVSDKISGFSNSETGFIADIELAAPDITNLNAGLYNTGQSFTVSGYTGALLEVSFDNGESWSEYSGPVDLSADGDYYVVARQTDLMDTVSQSSVPIHIIIDSTLINTTELPQPSVSGISQGTFNTTQSFTISGLSYADYEYSLDNGTTWLTYDTTIDLTTDGSYQVTARQTEPFGLISAASSMIAVVIDTDSSSALLTGTPDPVTRNTALNVAVGGSDIVAYKYRINNGAWSDEILTATLITDTLTEGGHLVEVVGKDNAGNWQNEASPTSFDVTVDLTAPDDITGLNTDDITAASIDLSWTNPADDFSGVLIVGDTAGAVSFTPIDGATYTVGYSPAGTQVVMYAGSDASLDLNELSPDTQYYFKAYTYDDLKNYSSGVSYDDSTLKAIIYVDDAVGDNNNDGLTGLSPLKTIQAGINKAASLFETAEVHVKAGVYNENILLKNGVSLYGGYNASNWNDRNNTDLGNATYKTKIAGLGEITVKPTDGEVMSTPIVIDGFTITANGMNAFVIKIEASATITISNNDLQVSSGMYTYAISSLNASLTIENNTIDAGTATQNAIGILISSGSATISGNTVYAGSGSYSTGISIYPANIIIEDNTIDGGSGNYSSGIALTDPGTTTIRLNRINGGSGTSSSMGIYMDGSNAHILNNSITGGTGTNFSRGIYIYQGASPEITGNTINAGTSARTYGIEVSTYSGASLNIAKNKIHGGTATIEAAALYFNTSTVTLMNNIVYGGTNSGGATHGVLNDDSTTSILHNTIDGGSASTNAYAVYLFSGPVQRLENNILYGTSAGARYGVYEDATDADPDSFRNNNIFDCTYYHDDDAIADLTNVDDLNLTTKTTNDEGKSASGNITLDMIDNATKYYFTDFNGEDNDAATIEDNVLTVTTSAPVNIRAGGRDILTDVTDDFDGSQRTTGYDNGAGAPDNTDAGGLTIGAYELD